MADIFNVPARCYMPVNVAWVEYSDGTIAPVEFLVDCEAWVDGDWLCIKPLVQVDPNASIIRLTGPGGDVHGRLRPENICIVSTSENRAFEHSQFNGGANG